MLRALTAAVVVATTLVVSSGTAAGSTSEYRPPVDAPIVDGFRPPPEPWQRGNRGIDYGTSPGDEVHAAADGVVVFAGDVAGSLHVTVLHPDGLRTSSSFLAEVRVVRGQRVRRGDVLGTTAGPFHFGVRAPDGTYLDPVAVLEGRLRAPARLVPGADEGERPLWEERSGLLQVVLDAAADTTAAIGAEVRQGVDLSRLALHYAIELDPATHAARLAEATWDWWRQSTTCTDASDPTPVVGDGRILVEVSGLGTASTSNSAWELDATSLGYSSTAVVHFSYRGGRAPDDGASDVGLPSVPMRAFTSIDSQQSIDMSAQRLAALLDSVAHDRPGVPIDVVAHSQGGVVARLAIERAGDSGRLPDEVASLVTIGSPHQGAPLATSVDALGRSGAGERALDALRGSTATGPLDDRLPAIGQLAETSALIAELHRREVPDRVRFVTIGSAGDLTVPGTAAVDRAADARIVLDRSIGPSVHGDQMRDPEVTREVALAVAGRSPSCRSLASTLGAWARAEGVRTAETTAGALATGLAVVAPAPPR